MIESRFRRGMLTPAHFLGLVPALFLLTSTPAPAQSPEFENGATPDQVAALGRLEPLGGVIRLAAPSTPLSLAGSVVSRLLVSEGEDVTSGQLLAVTDAEPALEAALRVARAELALQREAASASRSKADEACVIADVLSREADRRASLLDRELASREEAEQSRGDAEAQAASCTAAQATVKVADAAIVVAAAEVELREAELDRSRVYAPFDARVLRITAEPGEYVGAEGVLELGRVEAMMAIAEVFETDVRHVRLGQRATVTSDALGEAKTGQVAFIRPKVQKQDEIGTDPAARKDARIVEVGIRLDDPGEAAGLTNLQVEVVITP